MNKKSIFKAIVAIAVALAFILPTSASFANVGTIGVTSDVESTGDIEIMVESTNDNSYDYTEDTIDNAMPLTGNIIYVGGSGSGNYSTIQEGVNAASTGDTVYVYNGTYYEKVTVNKQLNLIGESRENVIVNGGGSGNVVKVIVGNVDINNFTMRNGQHGIYITGSPYCTVTNCNLYSNSGYGVHLGDSPYSSITNCLYNDSHCGTHIEYSSNCTFINDISYDSNYGNWIFRSPGCNFTNCVSYNNTLGITLYRSPNCKLRDNNIYNNRRSFNIETNPGAPDIEDYYHDIDISNMINGKPMRHLVKQKNITLNETHNIGYLGLISCTNITAKNSDVSVIILANTSDSTLDNVSSYNGEYGIWAWKFSNSAIVNCTLYNNSFYHIKFTDSSNNVIRNCDLYNSYYGGFYLGGSSNNIIENCNFYDTGDASNKGYGIYLSSSPDNIVANCTSHDNSYRGIYSASSPRTNITNCTVYNNLNYGIYLYYSPNCNLKGNTLFDNAYNFGVGGGFSISDFHQNMMEPPFNTIDGKPIWYLINQSNFELNETHNFGYLGLIECTNITAKNSDVNGVLLIDTSNSTIDNVSSHNCGNGIYLQNSPNNNIINCDSYDNYYAIKISSSNINITNCSAHDSNYGIYFYGYYHESSNCTVTNCDVYNNRIWGITLSTAADECSIINCNVYDNSYGTGNGYGIYASASSNGSIMGCYVHGNNLGINFYKGTNYDITNCNISNNSQYGIRLSTSDNNIVYYNNFVNNIQNAYDNTYSNQWDDGIGEGNYWSDYTGEDNDGDGIGDDPYDIPGKTPPNQDRYPSMDPFGEIELPPVITHVQATPPVQKPGEPLNITCTVTDDIMVDTVTVNITTPSHSTDEFIMTNITGTDDYYHDATYAENGTYDYFIWANDTSGNDATSAVYHFIISDDDLLPPVITDVTATPPTQVTGGYVNITANVTDDVGVDTVKVNITYPDSSTVNVTMSEGSHYYNTTYAENGTYNYFIWANDTSGNNATSAVCHFIISDEDTKPPGIYDVIMITSDPLDTIIGWENVLCTVIDGVGVDEVKLFVTYNTTTVEYTMIKDGDTYSYNTTLTDAGDYTYHIWANDTSNNENTSASETFVLPPNYEVDMDYLTRIIGFWDLVEVVKHYGETGDDGWIREDVDNDGTAGFWDLVEIVKHYGESW